jgi:hypothetical protein
MINTEYHYHNRCHSCPVSLLHIPNDLCSRWMAIVSLSKSLQLVSSQSYKMALHTQTAMKFTGSDPTLLMKFRS